MTSVRLLPVQLGTCFDVERSDTLLHVSCFDYQQLHVKQSFACIYGHLYHFDIIIKSISDKKMREHDYNKTCIKHTPELRELF